MVNTAPPLHTLLLIDKHMMIVHLRKTNNFCGHLHEGHTIHAWKHVRHHASSQTWEHPRNTHSHWPQTHCICSTGWQRKLLCIQHQEIPYSVSSTKIPETNQHVLSTLWNYFLMLPMLYPKRTNPTWLTGNTYHHLPHVVFMGNIYRKKKRGVEYAVSWEETPAGRFAAGLGQEH